MGFIATSLGMLKKLVKIYQQTVKLRRFLINRPKVSIKMFFSQERKFVECRPAWETNSCLFVKLAFFSKICILADANTRSHTGTSISFPNKARGLWSWSQSPYFICPSPVCTEIQCFWLKKAEQKAFEWRRVFFVSFHC